MYRIAILVTVSLIVLFSYCMAEELGKEKAAVLAAQKWVITIDKGKYEESWMEAAEYFKNVIKMDQWKESLKAVREPLGKLISRKVKNRSYMTSLPGASDGEYFVVQFETSFENKESAAETITPMIENDGKWRVSGYYIQ